MYPQMHIFFATWSTIAGLALMLVGGLVLWAYGGRRATTVASLVETGPEAEATKQFHQRLSRWFIVYGSFIVTIGLFMLIWAASNIFEQ